jgi:hypothetical protein
MKQNAKKNYPKNFMRPPWVNASHVTLDLCGFSIINTNSGNTATAISIFNKISVAVRNGTIDGFEQAVQSNAVFESFIFVTGVELDELKVTRSLRAPITTLQGAIDLTGRGNIVRNCSVFRTGFIAQTNITPVAAIKITGPSNQVINSTVLEVDVAPSSGADAYGIYVSGSGNFILANRISDVQHGIYFTSDDGGKYANNLTGVNVPDPFEGGTDAGNNQ